MTVNVNNSVTRATFDEGNNESETCFEWFRHNVVPITQKCQNTEETSDNSP